MIQPTRRALLVFAAGLVAAILPVLVASALWPIWVVYVGAALSLLGVDAALGAPSSRLEVAVRTPALLYIGSEDPAELTVGTPNWSRRTYVEVLPELGEKLTKQPLTRLEVPPNGRAKHAFPLVPKRRGRAWVHGVWLRWTGPLGLASRTRRELVGAAIDVVPNVRAVRSAAVRFFEHQPFLVGLKRERYVGAGSEFDSLREYLPGLDHRAIDWKASARHHKLLVRDFRAERNHQVVLAFDTGHLMGEPLDGIPRLDHAINAGLLLGWVCLKTGDRVGLFGFDQRVRLFVKPQGGLRVINRLTQQTSELAYGEGETNFTLGLTDLLTKLRRRSLVVVFTDFVDVVTAELMMDNLQRVARRHVLIFVSLRDPTLDRLAYDRAPQSLHGLNEAVVARDFLREREVVLERLRRLGVHCIDASTDQIRVELINRYLDIHRRELV